MITCSQVEMEYKKNRQKVIIESLGQFKSPSWNNLSLPALLSETDEAIEIEKLKKQITEKQNIINKQINNLLEKPLEHDRVLISLDSVFKSSSQYNLHKNHPNQHEIVEKSLHRFMLGYPPRKNDDTSIGDAINWEWIIHCASSHKKNVIIVSRDGDYGASHKEDDFINDWLQTEFKERVGNEYDVILTSKLSKALKLIDVKVTDELVNEEEIMIKHYEQTDIDEQNDNVSRKIFDIIKKYQY